MSNEERRELMEKRSSLRSWRERGGKMPHRGEIIGVVLIGFVFISLIATSFFSPAQDSDSSPLEQTAPSAPSLTPNPAHPSSIPAPSIRINYPQNITYDTSTPPLDFIVAGSNLDSVLLSVDWGTAIAIPHDGTVARIDFAKGNPIFIDDFNNGAKMWKNKWQVIDSKYSSGNGMSSTGNIGWNNYNLETNIKLESGKDITIHFKIDNEEKNYYRLQTRNAYSSITLYKIEKDDTAEKGYTVRKLISASLPQINPTDWHIWKINSNEGDIEFILDNTQILKFNDSSSYSNGKISFGATDSLAYFDYVSIYKPLKNGPHTLTISAKNTDGNTSSQTVHFNVNFTAKKVEDIIGIIGLPVVKNGLEITVMSATPMIQFTNIWLSVNNTEDKEKPFKVGPGTILIDNMGQQYELVKVIRSAELAQTNFYPNAMRDGALYFEKLKDDRTLKKLVLNVNGEIFNFMLDVRN